MRAAFESLLKETGRPGKPLSGMSSLLLRTLGCGFRARGLPSRENRRSCPHFGPGEPVHVPVPVESSLRRCPPYQEDTLNLQGETWGVKKRTFLAEEPPLQLAAPRFVRPRFLSSLPSGRRPWPIRFVMVILA